MKIYLDHIGIACNNLDDASPFWRLIGLQQGKDETVIEQGVTTRFFATSDGDTRKPMVELLEPTGDDTPIGKFLAKRGPGVQQICFRVEDIDEMISMLTSNGIIMIEISASFQFCKNITVNKPNKVRESLNNVSIALLNKLVI